MLHLLFTFRRIYQSVVGNSVDCRPGHAGGNSVDCRPGHAGGNSVDCRPGHAGGNRHDRPCQGGCANPQEWIGRFPWFAGKKASRRIGLGKLMNWVHFWVCRPAG